MSAKAVTGGPIRSLAVLGSGVAAWSAAAAFAKRLPGVAVTVVTTPGAEPALIDLLPCAAPSAGEFHRDLGLDEGALLAGADGLFRLGTVFEGWTAGGRYVHAYGGPAAPLGSAPLHLQWLATTGERGGFGEHSAAAALAEAGRFRHPAQDARAPLTDFGYGYQLDPGAYAALLHRLALAAGARKARGPATAETTDGRVTALRLADGVRIAPDLVVDAEGAVANVLDPRFENWSAWLACDEALVASAAPDADPPSADLASATPVGIRLQAPLRSRTVHAHLHAAEDGASAAERLARHAPGPQTRLAFRQGRRTAAWTGNVVAIGAAAVAVEPLEAMPLHLVHAHVDRIIAALPGRDCDRVEVADYNRQTAAEADRIRDFLVLHHHLNDRAEPRWRAAAASAPPQSLAGDLRLFGERGRLPLHDGETFARESWLQVLLGQGAVPRRLDPLALETPAPAAAAHLAALRTAVAEAAASAPRHGAYVARLLEGVG